MELRNLLKLPASIKAVLSDGWACSVEPSRVAAALHGKVSEEEVQRWYEHSDATYRNHVFNLKIMG